MENLMRQMRGRFSGAGKGKTEESSSSRNQRIPPQKTQSFKGEKRTQNWFQKQCSEKMMNWNHDSNHTAEQVVAVAVAAATYVIYSIAETSIRDKKKTSVDLEPSLIKDKSRKEDSTFPILKPGTVSEPFSGEGLTKSSESAKSKVPVSDEKATRRAPSFKKPLSFADHLGSTSSTKPTSAPKPDMLSRELESAASKPDLPDVKPESTAPKPDLPTIKPVSTAPKPDHPAIKPGTAARRPEEPPTIKPVAPGIEAKRQSAARPGTKQIKADAWEKAEMTKIKERHVKLNSTILAWEEKKKKKAKNRLDKAEKSESEKKRARALIKFRNEMEYIKQVADEARAQAEARQRKDMLKAKEKANIIRTTGEVPRTCFCC